MKLKSLWSVRTHALFGSFDEFNKGVDVLQELVKSIGIKITMLCLANCSDVAAELIPKADWKIRTNPLTVMNEVRESIEKSTSSPLPSAWNVILPAERNYPAPQEGDEFNTARLNRRAGINLPADVLTTQPPTIGHPRGRDPAGSGEKDDLPVFHIIGYLGLLCMGAFGGFYFGLHSPPNAIGDGSPSQDSNEGTK